MVGKAGATIGIVAHINNLRGIHEGRYRRNQYMTLVKSFLQDMPQGIIRGRLTEILDNQQAFLPDISHRAIFVKSMLGLLQEISYNRDDRMGFDERTCISIQFLKCMIGLTEKCLGIIRDLDLSNRDH